MDRRDFLQSSVASLLGAYALAGCGSLPSRPPERNVKLLIALERDPRSSLVKIYDMKDGTSFDFVVPLGLPHATLMSPIFPDSIYFFEFMGSAVRYNVRTGEMVSVAANPDHPVCFSGHAVESFDGKIIWCTEEFKGNRQLIVRARHADSLEIVPGEQYSYPGGHQVIRLPGTNILVSHPGENINFFDMEKLKVVQTNPIPSIVLHMTQISSTEIIAGAFERSPKLDNTSSANLRDSIMSGKFHTQKELPLIYASLNGEVKSLIEEDKKHLFRMNYAMDFIKPGSFLSTHNKSNTVLLWEDFKIKHTYNIPAPLNVIYNPFRSSFYVVSLGKLKEYSLTDHKEIMSYSFPKTVLMMATMKI